MLKQILTVGVSITDPDQAIDFYVNKLGLEKRMDAPMGEGMRWIEVAPPGAQTALVLAKGYGPDQDRIGKFTGYIFATDDIEATYETLKSRGWCALHKAAHTHQLKDWGDLEKGRPPQMD